MTKIIKVVCDNCANEIEWTYYTIENHRLKSPMFQDAVYVVPREQATYCSMECVGKALEWWAEKYDKEKDVQRRKAQSEEDS